MRKSGRTAPGLMSALKTFFKTGNQRRRELKKKKKRRAERIQKRGYGGGAIIRTSHVASRRYSRLLGRPY